MYKLLFLIATTSFASEWIPLPPVEAPKDVTDFAIKTIAANGAWVVNNLRLKEPSVNRTLSSVERLNIEDTVEYNALNASIKAEVLKARIEINVKYKELMWQSRAFIGHYSSLVKYDSLYTGIDTGTYLVGYSLVW